MKEFEFKRLWLGEFKPEVAQHKEVLKTKTFEGIYEHKCIDCGENFLGYKWRIACKACDDKNEIRTNQ